MEAIFQLHVMVPRHAIFQWRDFSQLLQSAVPDVNLRLSHVVMFESVQGLSWALFFEGREPNCALSTQPQPLKTGMPEQQQKGQKKVSVGLQVV